MTLLVRLALVATVCNAGVIGAEERHTKAPSLRVSPTRDAVLRRHSQMTGQPIRSQDRADPDSPTAAKPSSSASEIWSYLQAGNRRFVAGTPSEKAFREAREKLVEGQNPGAIVLACSDSRVSPEIVFDQGLGDIFVVRTAGNVADAVAIGSVEYAVEHLHAKLLVVLGHHKCGAVTAAASGTTMPSDNLTAVVAKITPALADLRSKFTGEELIKRGVVANVHRSAREIIERSPILKKAIDAGELTVVEGVYELDTGKVVTP